MCAEYTEYQEGKDSMDGGGIDFGFAEFGCLGCGSVTEAAAQPGANSLIVTDEKWREGPINPLPGFQAPNDLYTSLFLPGPYLPLSTFPSPQVSEDGLRYYGLDADMNSLLAAFWMHECVHRDLIRGLVPAFVRLAAARMYVLLVMQAMSTGFRWELWESMLAQSRLIGVIGSLTNGIHEAAANFRTGDILNMPDRYYDLATTTSVNSLRHYAHRYGNHVVVVFETLVKAVEHLSERFAPHPLHPEAFMSIIEYAISSAIRLEDLAADLFRLPQQIAEHELEGEVRRMGSPFGISESTHPPLLFTPCEYTLEDVTWRLFDAAESVVTAEHRTTPCVSVADQLLAVAQMVPLFREWLRATHTRRRLQFEIRDTIDDLQTALQRYGFAVPLRAAWELDVSALVALRHGDGILLTGKVSEAVNASLAKIPGDYWLAYAPQEHAPFGFVFGPYCREAPEGGLEPMRPGVLIVGLEEAGRVALYTAGIVILEGLRQQIACGKGVKCPFERADAPCCGASDFVRRVYAIGCDAQSDGWCPEFWQAPECHGQ